jgi:hypothetical protein
MKLDEQIEDKRIAEIKKEFEEKFNLHHPATDTRNRVWFWIKNIIQKEREEAYKSGYTQGAIEYSKEDNLSQTKGGKE